MMRHCFSARQRAHTASVDVCLEQYLVTVLYFTETNEGLVSSGGSELPQARVLLHGTSGYYSEMFCPQTYRWVVREFLARCTVRI